MYESRARVRVKVRVDVGVEVRVKVRVTWSEPEPESEVAVPEVAVCQRWQCVRVGQLTFSFWRLLRPTTSSS